MSLFSFLDLFEKPPVDGEERIETGALGLTTQTYRGWTPRRTNDSRPVQHVWESGLYDKTNDPIPLKFWGDDD